MFAVESHPHAATMDERAEYKRPIGANPSDLTVE